MKFFNALLLAAGASIGTAAIIDKQTGGSVRYMIDDLKHSIEDDFEDEVDSENNLNYTTTVNEDSNGINVLTTVKVDNNGFDILTNPQTQEKSVIMPLEDAINLYRCIEDSIGDDKNDYELYGDKALSFEKLYDLLEDELSFLDSLADTETSETTEE